MAHQSKPGTTQIALDISYDAKLRFETLHQMMGFRTKAQTLEAIIYVVSTQDKIDPALLSREKTVIGLQQLPGPIESQGNIMLRDGEQS